MVSKYLYNGRPKIYIYYLLVLLLKNVILVYLYIEVTGCLSVGSILQKKIFGPGKVSHCQPSQEKLPLKKLDPKFLNFFLKFEMEG